MIQDSKQMAANIQHLIPLKGTCYLQKIHSSSRLLSLAIRLPGQTRYLYLGRGHGTEGLWITSQPIPPQLRRVDHWVEYLRKHLGSAQLLHLQQVLGDRCLHLHYRKYGYENSFIFFWRGRSLYFLNHFFEPKSQKFFLMTSWEGKKALPSPLPMTERHRALLPLGLRPLQGRRRTATTQQYPPGGQEPVSSMLECERKQLLKLNGSRKKRLSLQRKLDKIHHDLATIATAKQLQVKLQSGEFLLDEKTTKLHYQGLEIKLGNASGLWQKKDRLFAKLKAYKKAQTILEARKAQTEHHIKSLQQGIPPDFQRKLKLIKPRWEHAPPHTNRATPRNREPKQDQGV